MSLPMWNCPIPALRMCKNEETGLTGYVGPVFAMYRLFLFLKKFSQTLGFNNSIVR